MSKGAVYSWRVSAETKAALEHQARREGLSLAGLLERISSDWLRARRSENGADAAEQQRLHAKAGRLFGSIAGGDPGRASHTREAVRERLLRGHKVTRETTRISRTVASAANRRSSEQRHKGRKARPASRGESVRYERRRPD